ncbi:TIP20 (YGL145W) [Zygosaccharomyces parabailii]|nr:TIP20 (YGL145W) [Zygosaccharomyces parabailii]
MELGSFDDLLNVDNKINQINVEREALAAQLNAVREEMEQSPRKEQRSQFDAIAEDIVQNGNSLQDVINLKTKYGDLQVLNNLQKLYEDQERADESLERLQSLEVEIDELSGIDTSQISLEKLSSLSTQLMDTKLGTTDSEYAKSVYSRFDKNVLERKAQDLANDFSAFLLECKWDTSLFVPISGQTITNLKGRSAQLYKLSQLYTSYETAPVLWNFKCIANNFNVRFTYHFHDASFKIETYFQFLHNYLNENMHKCISIFHDESNGLTKPVVHEQFVNYVLQPIRERINSTLYHNDQATLITLISQIISTDMELSKSFHYNGMGFASLVPPRVWDKWLKYEVQVAMGQLHKVVANPTNLAKSAFDFVKLLNKIYDYLVPFYSLEGESLQSYKLLTCSEIFIQLLSSYLDYVLKADLTADKRPEQQLYQAFLKLQSVNVVSQRISELSFEYIFVHLTDVVNEKENKNYDTVLQSVQQNYQKIIENGNQGSVVHRIQKLLKESLKNYFKSGNWCIQGQTSHDTPSSELVNSIKLMNRIMSRLDSMIIPLEVKLDIKCDLLKVIVNYFTESILRLNKFNREGLKQFQIDFDSLKDSLNLPEGVSSSEVVVLSEILKVLHLRYDDDAEMFIDSFYISQGDYSKLRLHCNIKVLKDSEIQDALYRIAYGNIILGD